MVVQKTVVVPEYEITEIMEVDPKKTALIIVDMQNDFVKEGGKLVVPTAKDTIPAIQKLLGLARQRGMFVAYTQDTHLPNDPEFPIWGEHVLIGTWGWEIIDELRPQPYELVVHKRRYDAFYGTPLEDDLRSRGIETLIITGTVSNICVLHTAGSAALRGFKIIIPKDCISSLTDFDMEATLRQIHFLYRGIITRSGADILLATKK